MDESKHLNYFDETTQTVYIMTNIENDQFCEKVIIPLFEFYQMHPNMEDNKSINLMIDSGGGDYYACQNFIGLMYTMQQAGWKFVAYCFSRGYSSAAYIFIAADYRTLSKNAVIMFHCISETNTSTNVREQKRNADQYHYTINLLIDFIDHFTHLAEYYDIEEELRYDWYLYPGTAIQFGYADEVISFLPKKIKT